jgi:hypothetical protein
MSVEKGNNDRISVHTEEYYEAIASQEEQYLEEGVEKLRERELLVTAVVTNVGDNVCAGERLPAEVEREAEELIAGDSDDAPLSDDGIEAMLKKTSNG